MEKLSHCDQLKIIETLLEGFLSARFDNIANLDSEIAEMTATDFFRDYIEPSLKELKETGQRMEDGLTMRRSVMSMSTDYLETTDINGKNIIIPGNLEKYYQENKIQLKKSLKNLK